MTKVFVYGTLKRGFPLFEKGLTRAEFLGNVRTVKPYPMFIAGPWYGPMMLDRPGEGRQVRGELFEVEEEDLPTLDALEAVGQGGSFRSLVLVEPLEGGLVVEAIGFMKSESWLDPVHMRDLEDYQDRRFIPPWARPKDD